MALAFSTALFAPLLTIGIPRSRVKARNFERNWRFFRKGTSATVLLVARREHQAYGMQTKGQPQ
jgi:hypothetical protein